MKQLVYEIKSLNISQTGNQRKEIFSKNINTTEKTKQWRHWLKNNKNLSTKQDYI